MGKRNTRQKCVIMHMLCSLDHPSATEVYEKVHDVDPSISRSTVFRVLSDEAAEGNIIRLHINGTDDRFDTKVTPHCHIRCVECGKVEDILTDISSKICEDINDPHGYDIQSCDIVFYGVCPMCKAKKDNEITA